MCRSGQERIEEWRDRGNGLVQRSRHRQEGASCFGRVAGLPESPVRDGEASRQLHAASLGFGAKSDQLRLGLHWRGEDDSHEVDEVLVARRRRPSGTMPLKYRAGLVRDVIGKRIGPVSMLPHIGHDHASQRRDVLRRQGFRMNGRRSSTPGFDVGTSWRLSVLLGGAFDVRCCLRYPPGRFRIADRVEEPAKEREAVPSPEPETGGVRREGVRERRIRELTSAAGLELRYYRCCAFYCLELSLEWQ